MTMHKCASGALWDVQVGINLIPSTRAHWISQDWRCECAPLLGRRSQSEFREMSGLPVGGRFRGQQPVVPGDALRGEGSPLSPTSVPGRQEASVKGEKLGEEGMEQETKRRGWEERGSDIEKEKEEGESKTG